MDASPPKSNFVVQSIARWCDFDRLESMLAKLAHPGTRPPLWIPLLLLIVGTLLLRGTNIDVAISGLFYDPATGSWPFLHVQPWAWIYHWGVIPGNVMGIAGLIAFCLSFRVQAFQGHRQAGLFLALALIIGPGLLVNGIMKPCWDRPRPCDLAQFGGDDHYLAPFDFGHDDRNASFPSGHASIGFALMAPMFLAYRRHRYVAAAFFALGMTGGTVMGVCRIVQGRHFVSDVLWSAAAVYFTCWLLGAIMQLYALPAAGTQTDAEGSDEPLHVFRLEDEQTWQADDEQQHKRAA